MRRKMRRKRNRRSERRAEEQAWGELKRCAPPQRECREMRGKERRKRRMEGEGME